MREKGEAWRFCAKLLRFEGDRAAAGRDDGPRAGSGGGKPAVVDSRGAHAAGMTDNVGVELWIGWYQFPSSVKRGIALRRKICMTALEVAPAGEA